MVPPVKDRDAESAQKIAVQGFRVTGVADHARLGLTPASIQALADAQYHELAGNTGQPVMLSFAQMQGVADKIVERYRTAGFIVSNAFLPAQTVGPDQMVEIQVLEGKIGKIIVKGTRRYRPGVISAASEKLRGKPLLKSDVDTALLYARDLPGVTVSSTFQPGEHTGDTDLVMVANEARRPYKFMLGGNNYGTDLTGQYRAQAGLEWDNPLRIGDTFNASVDYALDPNNNVYGTLSYRAPLGITPGLTAVVGASRSGAAGEYRQLLRTPRQGPQLALLRWRGLEVHQPGRPQGDRHAACAQGGVQARQPGHQPVGWRSSMSPN